uniref:Aquaporin 8b n=1 Tax=Cyprinus carpio TaxID=7962 RepID=A0A8C2HPR4_CYPCA
MQSCLRGKEWLKTGSFTPWRKLWWIRWDSMTRESRVWLSCWDAFFVFTGCVSVSQPAPAHGLSVAVGSYFSPAFLFLCGGMELKMVAPYLISQLTGGLLGAGMTSNEKYAQAQGAAFTALFGEIAMTCQVTMVVLLGAVNIMLHIIPVCSLKINIFCGELGPAVLTNYWTHHWLYWVGHYWWPYRCCISQVRLIFLGDNNSRLMK